jgi:hypothetical protein
MRNILLTVILLSLISSTLYAATFRVNSGHNVVMENNAVCDKTFTCNQAEITGDLLLYDSDGSNYVGLEAGATVTTDTIFRLPTADGTHGQVLATNGNKQLRFVTAASPVATSIGADMMGLKVTGDWTTPTSIIRITFDALQVDDYHITDIAAITADITVSGAFGLDTGAEANGQWYVIYVIYNPTTDTTAGLFSTSETSPTLPSGYTMCRKIGHVSNDANSNFLLPENFGDKFNYRGEAVDYDYHIPNLTLGAWTTLDISHLVPDGASAVLLHFRIKDDAIDSEIYFRHAGDSVVHGYNATKIATQVANQSIYGNAIVPLNDNREIEYYLSSVGWLNVDIIVRGWWR